MQSIIFATLFAGVALATEAIYLSNGQDSYTPCGSQNYDNGQGPSDTASVGGCGYEHWEGQTVSGTFSSGTSFTVNLDSGAQYYSVGQYAGYGSNSYGTGFDCFRDNDRQLYCNQGGCYNSIYYCKQT
ncbi:hypothetical protein PRZ48_002279 [Zasmidium cellare]|uniref:Uncharacterized protein n=1 Tax=Zasmidium cellare TaxID=395010 RepID=A0ABR0F5D0_ZASCE|nr:hypothetical protein PRZ48_002279 [Zasmidium cellare]